MIVACSALTFWAVSTKQTGQSDFFLRNVEALANGESSATTTWMCEDETDNCYAKCGICSTTIGPSKGRITGYHTCSIGK